jgi:integrase
MVRSWCAEDGPRRAGQEVTVAYVVEKPDGSFLARWREPDGKIKSRSFKPFDHEDPDFRFTPEQARARAQSFADEKSKIEPRARKKYKDMERHNLADFGDMRIFTRDKSPEFAFVAYLRRMIDGNKRLRESTLELYNRNIRNHIDGTVLAQTDIRDVTHEMLEAYWADLDLGVGATRNVHQLLSMAFHRALVAGDIDTNPMDRAMSVKRPAKGRREEVVPLTVVQLEKLADAATNPRDRLEILCMGYGGLRAGEVGGLREQDIDVERCEFRIRQQVVRVTGKGQYISPVKSDRGRRTVTMPCSVIEELEVFLKDNPAADDGRVFHGASGAMRAHNAIYHGVRQAGKRAKIHGTFSHMLRHTAVSLLVDDGANPKAIQAFCGHSKIETTMNEYGHLFDYGGKALGASMEARRAKYRQDRDKK